MVGFKHILALLGALFSVTLAIVIGTRLSADAMGVILGLLVGTMSVGTVAVVIVLIMARTMAHRQEMNALSSRGAQPAPNYPPVIVLNAAGQPSSSPLPLSGGPVWTGPQQRPFLMIGSDEEETPGAAR